jgi:hypothetical protein
MIDENLPISLRPANENDFGFILASIGTTTHKIYPASYVPNAIHFPYWRRMTERFISDYTCIVANVDGYSDYLAGFAFLSHLSTTSLLLPFAFVKGIYRRNGIFNHLLNSYDSTFNKKSIICPIFFHLFPALETKYHLIYDPTTLPHV